MPEIDEVVEGWTIVESPRDMETTDDQVGLEQERASLEQTLALPGSGAGGGGSSHNRGFLYALISTFCSNYDEELAGGASSIRLLTSLRQFEAAISDVPVAKLCSPARLSEIVRRADGINEWLVAPEKGLRTLVTEAINQALPTVVRSVHTVTAIMLDAVSTAASAATGPEAIKALGLGDSSGGASRLDAARVAMIAAAGDAIDAWRREVELFVTTLVRCEAEIIDARAFRRLAGGTAMVRVTAGASAAAESSDESSSVGDAASIAAPLVGPAARRQLASGDVDISGHLMGALEKAAKEGLGGWAKRWVVLWESGASPKLYYFRAAGDNAPRGVMPLAGCLCRRPTDGELSSPDIESRIFVVAARDGRPVIKGHTKLVLRAPTAAEADEWVARLMHACTSATGPAASLRQQHTPPHTPPPPFPRRSVQASRPDTVHAPPIGGGGLESLSVLAGRYATIVTIGLARSVPQALAVHLLGQSRRAMLPALHAAWGGITDANTARLLGRDTTPGDDATPEIVDGALSSWRSGGGAGGGGGGLGILSPLSALARTASAGSTAAVTPRYALPHPGPEVDTEPPPPVPNWRASSLGRAHADVFASWRAPTPDPGSSPTAGWSPASLEWPPGSAGVEDSFMQMREDLAAPSLRLQRAAARTAIAAPEESPSPGGPPVAESPSPMFTAIPAVIGEAATSDYATPLRAPPPALSAPPGAPRKPTARLAVDREALAPRALSWGDPGPSSTSHVSAPFNTAGGFVSQGPASLPGTAIEADTPPPLVTTSSPQSLPRLRPLPLILPVTSSSAPGGVRPAATPPPSPATSVPKPRRLLAGEPPQAVTQSLAAGTRAAFAGWETFDSGLPAVAQPSASAGPSQPPPRPDSDSAFKELLPPAFKTRKPSRPPPPPPPQS